MSEQLNDSPNPARGRDAETDALAERLRQRDAELASLRAELDETNRGVLALYAELDDTAQKLREASDLKSRFLSYMSHEFRTPLGAIRSITRILLDRLDGPLTEDQEKQVRFVQASSVELTDMVNDLLDLARVEAGRVTISPAWFQMVDLFSALRGMFKPILASDSVSLVFEEPAGIPAFYTDDKKLSQILRNFISNALKFTQCGEVRVTATLSSDAEHVTFKVADTGIGIAKEHLGAIFQDFVQVDSPIQKHYRGSGLGLSLSRKLAMMLGGDVSVESEPGVGSKFSVTIPRWLPGHEPPAAGPDSDSRPKTTAGEARDAG
jgi:signal transduction histidine kinase